MAAIYLKIDKNVKITGKQVTLGEIAQIRCGGNRELETALQRLTLPTAQITGPGRYVYSVMDVIDVIHKKYPQTQVTNLGEADFILTLEKDAAGSKIWQWAKTLFVCFLTFFGAAFSIMAFNNDVGITTLFGQLYELFTGSASDGFTVLELTYSVGLALGILLFFNHFGKRKITADPTPLEVEMRTYEDEIDTTLIEGKGRNKEKEPGGGT